MSVNQVVNGLWVGDANASINCPFIKINGISMIINCTKSLPSDFRHVRYIRVPIRDPGPNNNISQRDVSLMAQFLPHLVDIMYKEILSGGNILVHCRAGVQRSAAVAAAFLLKYHQKSNGEPLTVDDAVQIVLAQRPVAFYRGDHVNFYAALDYFNKYHLGRS